jgi:hypothetical protein
MVSKDIQIWFCVIDSTRQWFKDASGCFLGRDKMFDQSQFCTRFQLTEVDLIHERTDEEDAAAGAAQEVFRSKWVGETFPIDSLALIGNSEDERFAVVFEAGCDLFGRVVVVAVKDGIDGGLADGHGDAKAFFLVYAGLFGQLVCGSFNLADALHRRGEREAPLTWFGIDQRLRLRLYREWQSAALPREEVSGFPSKTGKRYRGQFHG